MKPAIAIHWFRRDLRLNDNTALNSALSGKYPVLPLFIFDTEIIEELSTDDARIGFIHSQLDKLNQQLHASNSTLLVKQGKPIDVWQQLLKEFNVAEVFFNRDYEPYAIKRDKDIVDLLKANQVNTQSFKDQVVFEAHEILKKDETPYTVYTPYKNQWLKLFDKGKCITETVTRNNYLPINFPFPSLNAIWFKASSISVKNWTFSNIDEYAESRDIPWQDKTSYLGPHLRFGTVSIREIFNRLKDQSPVFLSELIWREFFMQILFHFPDVVQHNFKRKYDAIPWLNNTADFKKWCSGTTGYPMVDAGMRQLNRTGYMHNRVRMVCASFLCKHLLIDWRWGEAYFAQKLLDYELASNNGNWQWAAGTGCDAAPYFRVFNPSEQQRKFDPENQYVSKWIEEFNTTAYPAPMIDHKLARERAISTYKLVLEKAIIK